MLFSVTKTNLRSNLNLEPYIRILGGIKEKTFEGSFTTDTKKYLFLRQSYQWWPGESVPKNVGHLAKRIVNQPQNDDDDDTIEC